VKVEEPEAEEDDYEDELPPAESLIGDDAEEADYDDEDEGEDEEEDVEDLA
jgi:hypothetical protein